MEIRVCARRSAEGFFKSWRHVPVPEVCMVLERNGGVGGPRIAALIHFCVFPFSVLCGQGGTAQRGKTIYPFLVGEFQGAG